MSDMCNLRLVGHGQSDTACDKHCDRSHGDWSAHLVVFRDGHIDFLALAIVDNDV
jgi:hypothetical protein